MMQPYGREKPLYRNFSSMNETVLQIYFAEATVMFEFAFSSKGQRKWSSWRIIVRIETHGQKSTKKRGESELLRR